MERSRRSTSSSIPCLHSRSRQGGNAWCACQTPGSLPSADRRLNDPKTPESVFTSGLIQHHRLDQCLHDYIEAAGTTEDVDGYLFRTARRKTGQLTTNPLFQQDGHRIIRRRAKAAGIETRIGNHTFRATGITAYLKISGKLEVVKFQQRYVKSHTVFYKAR